MKKSALVAIALCAYCDPSSAMTGAELIQGNKSFAMGYVYGAIDQRITALDNDDPSFYTVRNCIISSKADSETMYSMVENFIKTHPEALTNQSLYAVISSVDAMCLKAAH